jgi:hypothetical protein
MAPEATFCTTVRVVIVAKNTTHVMDTIRIAAILDRLDQSGPAVIVKLAPNAAHQDIDRSIERISFSPAREVEELIA